MRKDVSVMVWFRVCVVQLERKALLRIYKPNAVSMRQIMHYVIRDLRNWPRMHKTGKSPTVSCCTNDRVQ